jgi:uncharacterized protein YbjQ (UPF0145 family)
VATEFHRAGFLLSTTATLDGHEITAYKGLVVSEAIIGANIFRDLFARVRDIVGGRAGGYESALGRAREAALAEMTEQAQALGANAVVGIDLDYETINEMLMVCASGTAVVVQRRLGSARADRGGEHDG